jgi:hypothetical protein
VRAKFGWVLQTVLRPVGVQGFVVLPKRWIVERTSAWLARYRRRARDYERTTEPSETVTDIAIDQPHERTTRTIPILIFKTPSLQKRSPKENPVGDEASKPSHPEFPAEPPQHRNDPPQYISEEMHSTM